MELLGKTLGKYQIVEELGRGGMGIVYKAYDDTLERYVAIKVLAPHLTGEEEFVRRFAREARAAAALRHPHIVTIYEVGQRENLYYFVMEYLPGKSLATIIAEHGPLPLAQVLAITEQIASALDYAHKRGLVHRDIKAANILIDEDNRAVLTDFGVVRATAGTRLTVTGVTLGTPEYMAPEQARGEEATPASDLYALGVVVYEMLAGEAPFRATTPLAVIMKHALEPPPSLVQRNLGIAEGVEQVVQWALSKEAKARPASGAVFVEALKSAAAGRPVELAATATAAPAGAATPVTPAPPAATPLVTGPGGLAQAQPPISPPVQPAWTPAQQAAVQPPISPPVQPAWTPPAQQAAAQPPISPPVQRAWGPPSSPPFQPAASARSGRPRVPSWAWGAIAAFVVVVIVVVVAFTRGGWGPTPGVPTVQPTAISTAVPPTQVLPTEARPPKELVVCMGQEPDTLYIYGTSMLTAAHVQQAIYDGPFDTNAFSYQPVITEKLPSLADGDATIQRVQVRPGDRVVDDSGEPIVLSGRIRIRLAGCHSSECAVEYDGSTVEMEQMVVTFRLREGLTWADGTPVKASDSVYTYKLNGDPDTPAASRYLFEHTASYVAQDERTLVWTGLPGYRDSAYMTNIWQPSPEHIWGSKTAADLVSAEESSRVPLGYGAFTTKEWVAGDHITVVKNPYYFRAREGLPKVDTVIFRFIGEDANTAVAALLAGECDVLTQDLNLDSAVPTMLDLEAQGQIRPVFIAGTAFEHLDFCLRPVGTYQRPDFFGDVRMRQAIGMCLNRQQVVDQLLYGRSNVPASYVPPGHPLFEPSLQPLPYDPGQARALLDQMGWRDVNSDGIRECQGCGAVPAGTRLSFHWSSTTASLRVAYMQVFQANLKECGIEVILDNVSADEFFADGPEGLLGGRHYDVASFTWLTEAEPPCGLYLASQIPADENGWAGQNYIGYANSDFDGACNAALQSLPGTPEYERYHREAQRFWARDLPSIPLYLRLKIAAIRSEVSGFIMDPTADSEMWNIENFDVPQP